MGTMAFIDKSHSVYDAQYLQFHTDIDVTFTMTGETDNGLTFGASIDLDEFDTDRTLPVAVNEETGAPEDISVGGSPAFDNSTQGGESIFVSGAFGTLTMGDTDGAFDWAMQEVGILVSINDDHTSHAGFSYNSGLDGTYDGQIARYDYTLGDFSVALSAEIADLTGSDEELVDDLDELDDDAVLGIGFKYNTEFAGTAVGLAFGYQTNDNQDIYGMSADATLAFGLRAILNYSKLENDDSGDSDHYAIGLGYEFQGIGVAMNYGANEVDGDDNDSSGFGLVANYDLGGGAVLQAGYGKSDVDGDDNDDDDDSYSFGIAMSF